MVTQSSAHRRKASRPDFLSRPLGVAVLADHRRRARRAVCEEAQARRQHRHRERDRGALRRQPDRRARRAAHLAGARHRRDQDGQGRRRAGGARQSAAVRRGARGAARPHRRQRRRDHGRAARHRMPRRRACGRERHRRGHRAASADRRRCRGQPERRRALHRARRGIPSRRRRGLAQPRAGGAAHLAAARLLAAAQSDADAEGRRKRILDVHKELLGADRNPRRRRRAQADGRPRQDDPRPPGVGASRPNVIPAQADPDQNDRS